MSVADKLGTGSSFGHAPRGRSARGRAKAVTQGDVPAYELVRLRLDEVSPTPLNPRRNFGTDEDKTRFGEELRQAQLSACVAVTRDAYLALWPDHTAEIGKSAHVLINGERRYHSAAHVGLDALDFVVRDDLAQTREEFVNYLLQENLEREDFDVIERARGVMQLVDVCSEQSGRGARTRAAERLGKDRSWVTNQLALLELPDEIQAMLSAGSLPERDGRALSRHAKENPDLDAAALLDHLQATKDAAAQAKAAERAQLEVLRGAASSGLLSADNNAAGPEQQTAAPTLTRSAEGTDPAGLLSADNKPAPGDHTHSTLPKQQQKSGTPKESGDPDATAARETDQPKRLPYDDAVYIVHHLHLKMTTDKFAEGARFWMAVLRDQHPEEYRALLLDLTQDEQQPA